MTHMLMQVCSSNNTIKHIQWVPDAWIKQILLVICFLFISLNLFVHPLNKQNYIITTSNGRNISKHYFLLLFPCFIWFPTICLILLLYLQITDKLTCQGIRGEDIGVITPYNSQVNLIQQFLSKSVEIHTIDKYQVILCWVYTYIEKQCTTLTKLSEKQCTALTALKNKYNLFLLDEQIQTFLIQIKVVLDTSLHIWMIKWKLHQKSSWVFEIGNRSWRLQLWSESWRCAESHFRHC